MAATVSAARSFDRSTPEISAPSGPAMGWTSIGGSPQRGTAVSPPGRPASASSLAATSTSGFTVAGTAG
jgi:hypothetical protein